MARAPSERSKRGRRGRISGGAALALALLAGACAVGPDYVPAAPPPAAGYTKGRLSDPGAAAERGAGAPKRQAVANQAFAMGADIPGQWWTLFRNRGLNALVEEALARNPTLEAAQASLRVARQNVEAQKGTLFPSVVANPQASYQKAPGLDLQSPLNDQGLLYSLYTPQLQISYTPDVFGGNRRQIESLEAQAENERFQLEAAYLTLTSNVVLAAIQEASLRAQVDATRRVIQVQTDILNSYNKQLSLGQLAGADVAVQQAALAGSLQLLPPLERQLAQQRSLLTALTGRLPSDEVSQTFTLDALQLPTRLPVSLPSRLVRQRPDVRAAEASVQQASAAVGVAVANRLPQFNITVTGGSSAVRIAQLASPGASFFAVVGSVTQPVFDAGTLFRRQRAAEESLAQVQAQYKATVIAAMQNVADALRALQSDAASLAASEAAERATRQSLDLVRKQFAAGGTSNLTVLIAQQAYLQALVASAQARANRYADTAALFQALGGGWWNRDDVKPAPPETDPFKFI